MSHALKRIPRRCRHMLTLDKGKEFRRFGESEIETGPSVYFPDTYSTWQSGNNESTNGLVRGYAPNGYHFSEVTETELAAVIRKINHRPRESLGYRSPQRNLSGSQAWCAWNVNSPDCLLCTVR